MVVTRSEKVDALCKLSYPEKKKVCLRFPPVWKMFPDPASVEGDVPDEQVAGEVVVTTDELPVDLDNPGNEDMTHKKGNHITARCLCCICLSLIHVSLQVHPICNRG